MGVEAASNFFDQHVQAKHDAAGVATATAAEALAAVAAGTGVLVDKRSDDARKISTIKGAITEQEFDAKVASGEIKKDGVTVFSHCWLGGDSCEFSGRRGKELKDVGFTDVKSVRLGTIGLADAGATFVTPAGDETKDVHNVAPIKGMYPEGFNEKL